MITIRQLTRFLAGLGEIVNILTAPVVAALAYLAAMERFLAIEPAINQDIAIFTSIVIALVAVGFINGGFAALLSIRRLLAEGHDGGATAQAHPAPAPKTPPKTAPKTAPKTDDQTDAKANPKPNPKAKAKPAPKTKAKR